MKRFWGALLCVLIILNMAACSAQQEETKTSVRETEAAPSGTESVPETPVQTEPSREPGAPLDVKDAPKICVDRVYSLPMPTEAEPERVIRMDAQGNAVTAAKTAQAMMVATQSPPFICPSQERQEAYSSVPMPVSVMTVAMKMNMGSTA